MSHLERERTCVSCGQAFRLADHAIVGAEAVAHALDAGSLADDDAPDVVRTCPKCLGTERMDASEAHAELFRLEHAATQARGRQISPEVKTYASGLAFMGMSLSIGSLVIGYSRGQTMLTVSGMVVGGLLTLASVAIGVVAFARVYSRRRHQL